MGSLVQAHPEALAKESCKSTIYGTFLFLIVQSCTQFHALYRACTHSFAELTINCPPANLYIRQPPFTMNIVGQRTCPSSPWMFLASSSVVWYPVWIRPHISTRRPGRAGARLPSAAAGLASETEFSGLFSKGDCSIYQLFRLSVWVALNSDAVDIKRILSIIYRGETIIHTQKKRKKNISLVQRKINKIKDFFTRYK